MLGFDQIANVISQRFEPELQTASRDTLAGAFAEDPTKSWRAVVEDDMARGIEEHKPNMIDALEREIRQRIGKFSQRRTRQ